jgi:pimeloyl-ACP methyl ester carboxylesterase
VTSDLYADVWTIVEGGLRLHGRDYAAAELRGQSSSATPVLCIPGLTRNCRDFEALAPWLARDRRVLTVDLRGRGLSDPDPNWRNYTLDVYVADVLAMLDHLRLTRVIVIGTSLGGLVGMYLAARHPQRIAGLVLNDIGPELDPAGMIRIASSVGTSGPVASWADAAAEASRSHSHALPDLSAQDWETFAHRVYREREPGVIERDMDPAIGRALRSQTGPLPDFWQVFGSLHAVPLLVIRGEHSDLFAETTLQRMLAMHPALSACTIPSRGHSPTLDESTSRGALEDFFNREKL